MKKFLQKSFLTFFILVSFLSFTKGFATVSINWDFPVKVLTPTGAGLDVRDPQFASDSTGTIIHAIWSRNDPVFRIIETASSYDGGFTWSVNTPLTLTGLYADYAQIATDSTGTIVHAVWARDTSFGGYVIQTMSSLDGGRTWSAAGSAVSLSTSTSGTIDSILPQIVTNNTGTIVHVIWKRSDTFSTSFWAETSTSTDSGATWPFAGLPTMLDTVSGFSKGMGTPQIACDSTGNKVHAIWKKVVLGPVGTIFTKTSLNAGGSWSGSKSISDPFQNSRVPAITTDSTGTKVHAIWYTLLNVSEQVTFTNTSVDSGSTWGPAPGIQLTISDPIKDSLGHQITTNSSGTIVHAVWVMTAGINGIVETMTSYNSGATWPVQGSATQLSLVDAFNPQIATDSMGNNVVVVWSRKNAINQSIEATNSIDGGRTWPPLGSEIILSPIVALENATNPQLIMNEQGSKVRAIWMRNNGINVQTETLGGFVALWPLTTFLNLIR